MTEATMEKNLIVNPEREKKELDAVERVRTWEIRSNEDFLALDSFLVGLNELKKEIVADFEDSKKAAKAAHQAICDQEKAHLDKLEEARRIGKPKLDAWKDEQRRLQEIEERRLADEAKKKADEEAQARALAAEKAGDKETAAAIVEEAAKAPAPVVKVQSFVPKSQTTSQTRWGATVTDPLYVKKAIEAAGKVLAKSKTKDAQEAAALLRQAFTDVGYMIYDQSALTKQATATKDALKLGGVTFAPRKV